MSGGSNINNGKSSSLTITLLGDPGAGKTSLKKRLAGKTFNSDEKITVGADFTFFRSPKLADRKVKICDIAGQASFNAVRKNYFKGSDAAIAVFDLTNPESLDHMQDWIREYIQANSQSDTPILLIGNKLDLKDERKISLKTVQDFLSLAEEDSTINDRMLGYIETSAKTGKNVEKSFEKIARSVTDI